MEAMVKKGDAENLRCYIERRYSIECDWKTVLQDSK